MPDISDPTGLPDLEDECNEESTSAYVDPAKFNNLATEKRDNRGLCSNQRNPTFSNLKLLMQAYKARRIALESDEDTDWCPKSEFDSSWDEFIEKKMKNILRPKGTFFSTF